MPIQRVADARPNAAKALAQVGLFAGLSETELTFLAQRAVPRKFSAGEIVFSEGDVCSGMYVVESGHIRIFKTSAGGREQVLSIDGPGGALAELPVFDGGNYPGLVSAPGGSPRAFPGSPAVQAGPWRSCRCSTAEIIRRRFPPRKIRRCCSSANRISTPCA